MSGIEYFEFGLDPEFPDALGASAEIGRRADIDHIAVAEIEGAAIEGAYLRPQFLDVHEALERPDQVGIGSRDFRVVSTKLEIAAHAGGQIDDDIRIAAAKMFDDFSIELGVAAPLAGIRIAYMDMGDRGAGLGRLDCRIRDLTRRHWNRRMLANRIPRTRYGAGDDHFAVHWPSPDSRLL